MKRVATKLSLLIALVTALGLGLTATPEPAAAQTGTLSVSAGGPYTGAVGQTILMTATVTGLSAGDSINQYVWGPGDGTTKFGQSISHSYSYAGTFTVTLFVSTVLGQSQTVTTTATIGGTGGGLTISAGGPYTGSTGQAITMVGSATGITSGATATFQWTFGDGAAATGQGVTKAYAAAGTYNVVLTVTTTSGQSAVASTTATITGAGGGLTVSAGGPYSVAASQPVTLTGSVSGVTIGATAQFAWNFGDGTSGFGQSVSHTYATGGTYTVTLTVTTTSGQAGSASTTVTVGQSGTFTASAGGPYTATTGQPITLTANASGVASGATTTYTWTFGDGGSATGQQVAYIYNTAGSFTALVTVTTSAGQSTVAAAAVTVTGAGALTLTTGGPYSGQPNTALSLYAQAYLNSTTASVTYTWKFGDGTSASGQVVNKTYFSAGTYTITVTATTTTGQTTTATTTATIGGGTGQLSVSPGGPYSATTGQVMTFSGTVSGIASGATAQYGWSFGDGTSGSGQTVSHTYTNPGTYTVSFGVVTSTGQQSTASTTVTVSGAATGSLSLSAGGPYSAITGQALTLTGFASNAPSGATVQYSWNFGDGTSGSGQSTTKTYTSAGTYTVTLTASSSTGQTGSTTATVTVTGGASGATEQVTLYAGCNNLAITWPTGTSITLIVSALTPQSGLRAVWRYDNINQRFAGYSPIAGAPNDLLTANRMDAVFICMNNSGSVARPVI